MSSLCSRCVWAQGKTNHCTYPDWKAGETSLRWSRCKHFAPKNLVEELRKQGFKPLVNIEVDSNKSITKVTKLGLDNIEANEK